MSEKHKIILTGTLDLPHKGGLRLGGRFLSDEIAIYLPPVSVLEELWNWGKVKITIEFEEYEICSCGCVKTV